MSDLYSAFRSWVNQQKARNGWIGGLVTVLLLVLVYVFFQAIGGIIGNTADRRFADIVALVQRPSTGLLLLSFLLLLALLVLLLFAKDRVLAHSSLTKEFEQYKIAGKTEHESAVTQMKAEHERDREDMTKNLKSYKAALTQMRAWALSQHLLLKMIGSVKPEQQVVADAENDLKSFMKTFLDQAVDVFGDIACGAAVLWPIEEGKYLVYYAEVRMTSHGDFRFVVNDKDREGVAGYAYRTQEIQRGLMINDKGIYRSSNPHYWSIPKKGHRQPPRYSSYIAIPLDDPDGKCLGVLCFDSPNEDTFDGDEIINSLGDMASGLAAALAAYQNFRLAADELVKGKQAQAELAKIREDEKDAD